jgi:hypothetical protein
VGIGCLSSMNENTHCGIKGNSKCDPKYLPVLANSRYYIGYSYDFGKKLLKKNHNCNSCELMKIWFNFSHSMFVIVK